MRQLLDNRYKKFRHIGQEGKYWRERVRSGFSDVFGLLAYAVSKMEKSNRKPRSIDSAPRSKGEKARTSVSTTAAKRVDRE